MTTERESGVLSTRLFGLLLTRSCGETICGDENAGSWAGRAGAGRAGAGGAGAAGRSELEGRGGTRAEAH